MTKKNNKNKNGMTKETENTKPVNVPLPKYYEVFAERLEP
jgi:hypothetical protein